MIVQQIYIIITYFVLNTRILRVSKCIKCTWRMRVRIVVKKSCEGREFSYDLERPPYSPYEIITLIIIISATTTIIINYNLINNNNNTMIHVYTVWAQNTPGIERAIAWCFKTKTQSTIIIIHIIRRFGGWNSTLYNIWVLVRLRL